MKKTGVPRCPKVPRCRKSLAHESGTRFGDNGGGIHSAHLYQGHTGGARGKKSTRVANSLRNLLRDSDSRCLGSDSSPDSSPGDTCTVQEGTGSSSAVVEAPSPLSLSFAGEGKQSARLSVRHQLWFRDQATVSLLCASFEFYPLRYGLLTSPRCSRCRCSTDLILDYSVHFMAITIGQFPAAIVRTAQERKLDITYIICTGYCLKNYRDNIIKIKCETFWYSEIIKFELRVWI